MDAPRYPGGARAMGDESGSNGRQTKSTAGGGEGTKWWWEGMGRDDGHAEVEQSRI